MADNRQPLGIELVRKGIVKQEDITKALEYQRNNPGEKIGDILNELNVTDSGTLLNGIGEILNEKVILLTKNDVKLKIDEYVSMDVARESLAVPFEINDGVIKVCFASTANTSQIESIRLLMLNKGLVMERYITFKQNIENVLNGMIGNTDTIDTDSNVTTIVDNIIRNGMKRRASDIHIEPMEKSIKVRYRIDGILVDVANIDKEKQPQQVAFLFQPV